MKKGLIIRICILSLALFMINAVSAESCVPKTCSSLAVECGSWNNGCGEKLDCGNCNNGACIAGECYSFSVLGKCKSLSEKYGSKEGTAQSSCSLFKENCLTVLTTDNQNCEWENSDLYTPKMYWMGKGGRTPTGFLLVSIDKNTIENITDIGISLTMVIENSKLPKGTNVSFEIYKSPQKFRAEPYEIRIANNAIKSVVDENGKAVAQWTITEEDLANANYNGYDRIDFDVRANGESLSSSLEGKINTFGTVESIAVDKKGLLLVTKKGECSGIISCKDLSTKFECEESAEEGGNCNWNRETASCFGQEGISCSVIGDGDICREWKCSWRAYNFWERFTDWLKILFRINN